MLSYNVLSLFDGKDDGSEFREFSVSGGTWDEARYRKRLDLLAEVLLAAVPGGKGPDLAILPEIENAAVLEELARGPLEAAGYRHRAISSLPGAAFATGLLSRLPILELRAHGLDAGGTESRNLLEARLDAGGGLVLTVLALHWKSKAGGAERTEEARREAAALASRLAAGLLAEDPGAEFILAGDFNENPDEWRRTGRRYATALFPAEELLPEASRGRALLVASTPEGAAAGGPEPGSGPVLFSPWSGSAGWSYLHEGVQERIDGFLLSPGLLDEKGLRFGSFRPLELPFLLDAEGAPLPWSSRAGRGYSDHLPILLELRYAEGEGAGSRPRMKKSQKSRVESP